MADLGTDISTPGAVDLDPMFSLVSGVTCLAQALARRLSTPRGALLDDPGYGYDLRAQLNGTASPASIASAVQFECLADERVLACRATATLAAGVLTVRVRVQSSAGPFTLVLAASAVTVDLLRVETP